MPGESWKERVREGRKNGGRGVRGVKKGPSTFGQEITAQLTPLGGAFGVGLGADGSTEEILKIKKKRDRVG